MRNFYFLFFFSFFIHSLAVSSPSLLSEAIQTYEKGLQSSSYQEQNQSFNHALKLFDQIAQQSPSASLFQIMGDCYFQLGEYAWAILFYQRSLKLDPQNQLASLHLQKVRQILHLPSPSSSLPFERLSILFWLSMISLLGACIWLIFPLSLIQKGVLGIWGLTSLLWVTHVIANFFTPAEGILIQASGIYSAPSSQYPLISNTSLVSGSQVQILQMTSSYEWVKIQADNQTIGYIPSFIIRTI